MNHISQNENNLAEIDRQQREVAPLEVPVFGILGRANKGFISTNESYFDTLVDETENLFFQIK